MELGARNKSMEDLGVRAKKVFHRLCGPRRLTPDPSLDKASLPGIVEGLMSYCTKGMGIPLVEEAASACSFVVRWLRQIVYKGPSILRPPLVP